MGGKAEEKRNHGTFTVRATFHAEKHARSMMLQRLHHVPGVVSTLLKMHAGTLQPVQQHSSRSFLNCISSSCVRSLAVPPIGHRLYLETHFKMRLSSLCPSSSLPPSTGSMHSISSRNLDIMIEQQHIQIESFNAPEACAFHPPRSPAVSATHPSSSCSRTWGSTCSSPSPPTPWPPAARTHR